jgi:hypothetical protein
MPETVVATKLCNALIADAQVKGAVLSSVAAIPMLGNAQRAIGGALDDYREAYGGLWVGGKATLTTTALRFAPNSLNRAIHRGDSSVSVALSEIVNLRSEWGFVTGIVCVDTASGTLKIRCYFSKAFMALIERTRFADCEVGART